MVAAAADTEEAEVMTELLPEGLTEGFELPSLMRFQVRVQNLRIHGFDSWARRSITNRTKSTHARFVETKIQAGSIPGQRALARRRKPL